MEEDKFSLTEILKLTGKEYESSNTPEEDELCNNDSTCCGASISDLYQNNDPWSYYNRAISPSRHHTVLYDAPVNLHDPPKPHVSSKLFYWDTNYVRMPFSTKNLFPVRLNNEDCVKPRWELIKAAYNKPIQNSDELADAICSYNSRRGNFGALHAVFRNNMNDEESQYFFDNLLPEIVKLALQLPELIRASIPLLRQGRPHSISFSQQQIASLLANSFLCTFPWKKENVCLPGINFGSLYDCYLDGEQCVIEKIKCLLHYFRRICNKVPVGVVTFERKHLPKSQLPKWGKLQNSISDIKLHVSSSGTIEDGGKGMLQVDFANRMVGGGVLSWGCVQEEIRFVLCPELLISRLFTEQLAPNEALLITGAECYSKYEGYASSFKWTGNCKDDAPFDESGRRRTSIIAIDALFYSDHLSQFSCTKFTRELNKAYIGYFEHGSVSRELLAPVATGNWGCGAFMGNVHLKALIQIMACTLARRNIVYYTFGSKKLQHDIFNIYNFLAGHNVTVGQLYNYLEKFGDTHLPSQQLLPFVKQCHIDTINSVPKRVRTEKCSPKKQKTAEKSPVKENTKTASPSTSQIQKTSVENPAGTASTSQSQESPSSFDPNDTIIEASQEDIDPLAQKRKINGGGKSTKTISEILCSSDEESQEGKCQGLLSALDNVAGETNTQSESFTMEIEISDSSGDESKMEVSEKSGNETTKSNSAKSVLKSATLITDYFFTKQK